MIRMSIRESQYKKILKDYELKRERSNKELRQRQEEVYKRSHVLRKLTNY